MLLSHACIMQPPGQSELGLRSNSEWQINRVLVDVDVVLYVYSNMVDQQVTLSASLRVSSSIMKSTIGERLYDQHAATQ